MWTLAIQHTLSSSIQQQYDFASWNADTQKSQSRLLALAYMLHVSDKLFDKVWFNFSIVTLQSVWRCWFSTVIDRPWRVCVGVWLDRPVFLSSECLLLWGVWGFSWLLSRASWVHTPLALLLTSSYICLWNPNWEGGAASHSSWSSFKRESEFGDLSALLVTVLLRGGIGAGVGGYFQWPIS